MQTILVTGAGGTVGSAVVRELAGADAHLRIAHRSTAKLEQARAAGLDAVPLDTSHPETLAPALAGVDAVFLLGAGGGAPQREGELAIVAAARAAGARKIVKLSAWRAADEPYTIAELHRTIERAIEASGLAWTFLRPNGFMQNFVTYLAWSIRGEGVFRSAAGDARISLVDVRDVARVAARALTSPALDGRALELSGPQALGYRDAATILSRVLGRAITYQAISEDAARAGMIAGGVPAPYVEDLLDLDRYLRAGGGDAVSGAVESVTGREPIGFEQFVREHKEALC